MKELVVLKDKEDIKFVESLNKLLEKPPIAMSEFQIRNFIFNDIECPTPAGKYFQAVRELHSRYTNLINLSYEYKKLQIEIEIHKLNSRDLRLKSTEKEDLLAKIEDIEIEKKERNIIELEKSSRETIREMKVFIDIISSADSEIPQELRNDDGTPSREKNELNYWMHKQHIAEQMHGDPTKTPFNKLMKLKENIKIGTDNYGRAMLLEDKSEHE